MFYEKKIKQNKGLNRDVWHEWTVILIESSIKSSLRHILLS